MARQRCIVTKSGSRYVLYESGLFNSVTRFSEKPMVSAETGADVDDLVIEQEALDFIEPKVGRSWWVRIPSGPILTTPVVKIEEALLTHVLD